MRKKEKILADLETKTKTIAEAKKAPSTKKSKSRKQKQGRSTKRKTTKRKKSLKKGKSKRKKSTRKKRARKRSEKKKTNNVRSKPPGADTASNCSASNGRLKPDVSKYGETNSGCPSYTFRDGECCKIDVDKLQANFDTIHGKKELVNIVKAISIDPHVTKTDKDAMIEYLKSQSTGFKDVIGSIKWESRKELGFVSKLVHNFIDTFTKRILPILTAAATFIKDTFALILQSATKRYEDEQDKKTKNKKQGSGVWNKVASYGGVAAAAAGIGLAATGAGIPLALAGSGIGAITGGIAGYVGPLKIISTLFSVMKKGFMTAYEGLKYVVMVFFRDPHTLLWITSTILAIKRSVCGELGVILKNPALRERYLGSGGSSAFKSMLSSIKPDLADASIIYAGRTGIEKAVETTSSVGKIGYAAVGIAKIENAVDAADKDKGSESDVVTWIADKIADTLGNSVTASLGTIASALKLNQDNFKSFISVAGESIRYACLSTLYTTSMMETFKNLMNIFSFKDCDLAYRKRKIEMVKQVLINEDLSLLEEFKSMGLLTERSLSVSDETKSTVKYTAAGLAGFGVGYAAISSYLAVGATTLGTAAATAGTVAATAGTVAATAGTVATAGAVALTAVAGGALVAGGVIVALYLASNYILSSILKDPKNQSVAERTKAMRLETKTRLDRNKVDMRLKLEEFQANTSVWKYNWKQGAAGSRAMETYFDAQVKTKATIDYLMVADGFVEYQSLYDGSKGDIKYVLSLAETDRTERQKQRVSVFNKLKKNFEILRDKLKIMYTLYSEEGVLHTELVSLSQEVFSDES